MKLSELMQDRSLVNRHQVPVLLSTDAAERCQRAERDVKVAERKLEAAQAAEGGRMSQPKADAARAQLEAAEAEYDAAEEAALPHLVDFVVESIGSDAWEELVTSHQSPDEQRERLGQQDPGYDLKEFPVAAIAACLAEPEVDGLDDVRDLKSKVPDAVWQQLFGAVLRVNRGQNRVPLSLTGSGTTTPTDDE